MQHLEQFKNPHIDRAVTDLYALTYLLTGRRQDALNSGLDTVAADFAFAETIVRRVVGALVDLDEELSPGTRECGVDDAPSPCFIGINPSSGFAEREKQQRNAAKAMGAMRAALGCSDFALSSRSGEGGL